MYNKINERDFHKKEGGFMKKKFFGFMLAFAFILTGAVCLTACGSDPKTYTVKIEEMQSEPDYLVLGNDQGSYYYSYEVEKGSNFSQYLYLDGIYDPNTLKIYNGENEVAWTREENSDDDILTVYRVKVGKINLNNIQADTVLKYEAQEKKITFTFNNITSELSDEKKPMLRDFKLESDRSKNLLDLVTGEEPFTYTTTYSGLNTPINFVCDKPVGYYEVNGLASCWFDSNPSVTKNTYSLSLPTDTHILTNQINFDLNQISVSTIFININELGSALTVGFDQQDWSYLASETKSVTLTLNSVEGANLDNAEVYINDTKIDFTNGQAFTLGMPINYMNRDLTGIGDFTTLAFSIKNVQIVDESKFCKVVQGAINGDEHMKMYTSLYYYKDEDTNTAYYATSDTVSVELNNGNSDQGLSIDTFTIFDGTNSVHIDLSKVMAQAGSDLSTEDDLIDILNNVYQTEYPNLPISMFRVRTQDGNVADVQFDLDYHSGVTYTISIND